MNAGPLLVPCASLSVAPHRDNHYDSDDDKGSVTLGWTSPAELNSKPDGHIEYDLTIQVPHDVIEDDHALALVQVVPPDADLSDIPESWDVYDIDLTGDLPDEEEKWEQSESDCYWEEDPPNDILDGPDEGPYYSEDPGEDQEYDNEPDAGSYDSDEPDAGSYHSDSPDEGNSDPETDLDSSGEG
jgi:hypothetical protein